MTHLQLRNHQLFGVHRYGIAVDQTLGQHALIELKDKE